VLFALQINPYVAVAGLFDFKGKNLDIILHLFRCEFAPNQPFNTEYRIFGISDRLPFGDLAYQSLTTFVDGNYRGGCATTLLIRDYRGVAAFHYGHTRICGPEIDSNYL
jgi:hypothetical protein